MTRRTAQLRAVAATGVAAAFVLAACSNDPGTYREETEEFIENDDDIEATYETTFSDATCEEPQSVDVGETYTCTAVDADGTSWVFDAEIDEEDSFVVVGTKEE